MTMSGMLQGDMAGDFRAGSIKGIPSYPGRESQPKRRRLMRQNGSESIGKWVFAPKEKMVRRRQERALARKNARRKAAGLGPLESYKFV